MFQYGVHAGGTSSHDPSDQAARPDGGPAPAGRPSGQPATAGEPPPSVPGLATVVGVARVVITEDVLAQGGLFLDVRSPYTTDQMADSLEQYATLHAATWGHAAYAASK